MSYEGLIPPLYPPRVQLLEGEYGPRKMIAADIGLCGPVTVWAFADGNTWDDFTTPYKLNRVFWSGGGEATAWPTPGAASHYKSERVYDGIRKERKRRKR
jgi:hypothetical protein